MTIWANEFMNPEWVETHAWANQKNPLKQLCPQSVECNTLEGQCLKNSNVEIAFKKLVRTLFDRNKFQVILIL